MNHHHLITNIHFSFGTPNFSSPELKAQVKFCVSVCLSVNFSHFHLLLQNHRANFNLAQSILGWKGLKFFNEGSCFFPRGDNYKIVIIHWRNLKISSFRTTGLISTKLGTKHPWVKGIQVCSNEGPCLFPRGNNYKIAKRHLPS